VYDRLNRNYHLIFIESRTTRDGDECSLSAPLREWRRRAARRFFVFEGKEWLAVCLAAAPFLDQTISRVKYYSPRNETHFFFTQSSCHYRCRRSILFDCSFNGMAFWRFAFVLSMTIFFNTFPGGLRGIIKLLLHLLDTFSSRDEHAGNDQGIIFLFGFFKFATSLFSQNQIPWLSRCIIGPMKMFGRT